jgi:hypothetical protein
VVQQVTTPIKHADLNLLERKSEITYSYLLNGLEGELGMLQDEMQKVELRLRRKP